MTIFTNSPPFWPRGAAQVIWLLFTALTLQPPFGCICMAYKLDRKIRFQQDIPGPADSSLRCALPGRRRVHSGRSIYKPATGLLNGLLNAAGSSHTFEWSATPTEHGGPSSSPPAAAHG